MRKYAVVFVHGLAKKPPEEKLKEIWLWGLERSETPPPFDGNNPGIDLDVQGVVSAFNYYADVFYGDSYETEFDSYYESESGAVVQEENLAQVVGELAIPASVTAEEAKFLADLERKMREAPTPENPPNLESLPAAQEAAEFEIASWLPKPVKEAVIKKAAMEAYYYLFDKEYVRSSDGARFQVRQELRDRLIAEIKQAKLKAEKVVLVTHSMGTMIAYDVIRNHDDCPAVDVLFTLGSPLGITEVQEQLSPNRNRYVDFPQLSVAGSMSMIRLIRCVVRPPR
ncbi:hypothetical protein I9H06_17555 [Pseudomonas tremae]|uniref:esterase/lipase family protein n=1 Tax=Pseudomonas tremae TaxID=200454 RepID=UPI0020104FF2|nr:hypothetical protein [Pseudomonas tremae]UQB30156.1 hypothetical protein I9H06_17555 [Pseudomonas tremae]